MIWYILLFTICCLAIFYSGKLVVESLAGIARFLNWREFVVAFFVIALAGAIPNLFVGISSALHGMPELSFGDIIGGNLFDLTIVVALAVLISNGLPAQSRAIQTTSAFTVVLAILPLLLILDGTLSRGDGIVLISAFLFYAIWLFSKRERFTKVYDEKEKIPPIKGFKFFLKDVARVVLGLTVLILAAEGIVRSAGFFAESFEISLALVGILIVAIGNALPETYFVLVLARSGQNWMILGDLMGSIIIPSTLVLGIVALINPIEIHDFSPFAIGRIFLIIAVLFFFFSVKSDRKITRKEALFLLFLYVLFVVIQILTK